MKNLLEVKNLEVVYSIGRGSKIQAVSNVSFQVKQGETLGLVGESGCGKSTIAGSIVRLQQPRSGEIWFKGTELATCSNRQLRKIRPGIQMIFQDAAASLNPGRKIGYSIAEPLRVMGWGSSSERKVKASDMMTKVGLNPATMFHHYPHQFSGGQCQRINIARALVSNPKLLICDEPVSSLDVSIQAQVLNLLEAIKNEFDLSLLFISHDLAVVKHISDRIAVMYLGKICEIGPSQALYESPRHPYTAALLDSILEVVSTDQLKAHRLLNAEMPSPVNPPSGCRFRTRCPRSQNECEQQEPMLVELPVERQVACHYPLLSK